MLRDRMMMARTALSALPKRLFAWGLNSSGQIGDNSFVNRSSPVIVGTSTRWTAVSAGGSHSIGVQAAGSMWSWGEGFDGQLGYPFQDQFAALSGGRSHSIGIKTDSTLWAWGGNDHGHLGDEATTSKSSPVQVGLLADWTTVSAGAYHNVAIKTDSTLWAWGRNVTGILGDNASTLNKSSPAQIGTLSTWEVAIGGHAHTVARKTDSTLWAWGSGDNGYTGQNSSIHRSSPTQIGTLATWSRVFSASIHNLALKTDSTLWAWGYSFYGELGDQSNGVAGKKSSPAQIGTLATWSSVGAGRYHSLAVKTDSTLWAWGYNLRGQLGIGANTNHRSSPTQVGTLADWVKVFAGGRHHSLGVKSDSTLWSWGYNGSGQLGLNAGANRSSPIQIGTLLDWNLLGAGFYHSLAINNEHLLYSWGANGFGQLGNNSTTERSSPTQVGFTSDFSPSQVGTLSTWKSVYGGASHSLAIKTDSTLWAWGKNTSGQLGINTIISKSSPSQIGGLAVWNSVSAGGSHSLALRTNSTMWSWGNNAAGQLGFNNANIQFRTFPIKAGSCHALVIKTDSTLWAWGAGSDGSGAQGLLGDNTTLDKSSPIQIGALADWRSLGAGDRHSLAVRENSSLWAWGYNNAGRLGINTATNVSSPTQVGTLMEWAVVVGGGAPGNGGYSAAIKTNSTLWAWGQGINGQLGNDLSTAISSPVQIGTLSGWFDLSGGIIHTLATKSDGTLWAWGNGASGKVGDNSSINKSSPTQIGTLADWSVVSAGGTHSLAVKTNSTLWAWGAGSSGQLGDGLSGARSSPTQIGTLAQWVFVVAGGGHSVAFKTDSTLWAWGLNTSGQLGNNVATTVFSSPVQIGNLSNWNDIFAGSNTTLARNTAEELYMWGAATRGILGDNTTINKSSPVLVSGLPIIAPIREAAGFSSPTQIGTLSQWSSIVAATSNSLALKTDSTLWAWGSNSNGQLGDNRPLIGSVWTSVAPGFSHSIAVNADSTLWAWGSNGRGQVGDTTTTAKSSPVQIGTLPGWAVVASGRDHSFALRTDSTLWAWGYDVSGQLGVGNVAGIFFRSSPTQVGTLAAWSSVDGRDCHSVAIKVDSTLWAWGSGFATGALGDNQSTILRSSPTQIGTLATWSSVKAGILTSLALKTDGTMWSWGDGGNGRLGDNATLRKSSPVQIGTLGVWRTIASSAAHALAITSTSTLWAWGYGGQGRLGTNDTVQKSSPTQIGTLANWVAVVGFDNSSIALQSNSTLWGWGYGADGQLGTGTAATRSSPIQIGTLANWTSIAGKISHATALNSQSLLFAWGRNTEGQVGDNSTLNKSSPTQIGTAVARSGVSSPTQVGTLATWIALGGSGDHYVAVKTDSTLWGWGLNAGGGIGDGTTISKSSPVQVGTLAAWTNVSGGSGGQTLATQSDGTLWAWGLGTSGQIGNTAGISRSSPVQVGTAINWSVISAGGSHDLATTA